MNDKFLYYSGADIPFPAAQLLIHQPTIKEIGIIGENDFWIGCEILTLSKENLIRNDLDKNDLADKTNFDILMSMINSKDKSFMQQFICAEKLLCLLFPTCQIQFTPTSILLIDEEKTGHFLENSNFEEFKQILTKLFLLKKRKGDDYNPVGELSQAIADKLRAARAKVAALNGKNKAQVGSVFQKYISILSVGLAIDVNVLYNYTVIQLFDTFDRFNAKQNFDSYVAQKLAGASNVKDVDYWMEDKESN